jgi:hypothetical protein
VYDRTTFSQAITVATMDLNGIAAPATLYPCYSPDNVTFTGGLSTATLQIIPVDTPAPETFDISSIQPTSAIVGSIVGSITLIGIFGSGPRAPVIAFSKTVECPLSNIMLPTPASITQAGTVSTHRFNELVYSCSKPQHFTYIPYPRPRQSQLWTSLASRALLRWTCSCVTARTARTAHTPPGERT